MEFQPYSIYADHRPFRVAFLVDPTGDQAWFDRVFEYGREKWGGRFYSIILTDGKSIGPNWWKFLRDYDPDFIVSTVGLSDDMLKKIHIFLTPLRIEIVRPGDTRIYVDPDPISILPTKKNLSLVAPDFPGHDSSLVLFEVEETTPEIIKTFLTRNFGMLEHGTNMTPFHLRQALDSCTQKIYKVTDLASLNAALLDLGEFRNRVVFPAQICSLPNSLKEPQYDADTEKFVIVIGDSADDIAYSWNRTMMISAWLRTGMPQMWVSTELAESTEIKPGLSKFINRCTGRVGNNNHCAHFVSFSLSEDNIKRIVASFNGTLFHSRTSAKYSDTKIPVFRQEPTSFSLREGLELYTAHSSEEHLVVGEPDVEEGGMAGQYWAIDLFMQFRSELFSHIVGKDYWWQLPKRNNLISGLGIFNKPARINGRGMFSIVMRRRSTLVRGESALTIKLPREGDIFQSLICGESFDCYSRDGRERFLSRPFYTIGRSDKGMYLSGVLSLFPGLWNASHFLEERYWREIFERMANRNLDKSGRKKGEVLNLLKKAIGRGHDFKKESDLDWLAQKVLTLAKAYVQKEVDLTFDELQAAAEQETKDYNDAHPGNQIPFDMDDFKRSVATLINWKVFLMGVKPRCPTCGYSIWYELDEARQQITCKGCGSLFSLDAEEEWYYRLNSLIGAAFSLHGTVPVLMVLNQMLTFDARTSFLYVPSIDLYKKEEGADEEFLYGELDLACIEDGKFVIGEIKQSVDLFSAVDFERMYNMAVLLKPDKVIFSSLSTGPNRTVNEGIAELKRKLADLEVEVVWYQIHNWVFDHKPVR